MSVQHVRLLTPAEMRARTERVIAEWVEHAMCNASLLVHARERGDTYGRVTRARNVRRYADSVIAARQRLLDGPL